jgi:LmbE family N-acetylglucosaminyl deacetylase
MGLYSNFGATSEDAKRRLNVLVFGAHPDDCDLGFAGSAIKYRALGHRVKFVSLTNGDSGHSSMGGGPLAIRRYHEAQAAGRVSGIEYEVLDVHDGDLTPNVFMRNWVIKIIRDYRADIVLCPRPNDYHPDHRATGVLVQDASYLVTVPNVAALSPILEVPPVVGYTYDSFTIPSPFVADVAIDTDDVLERKRDVLHCHESQVYEWMPTNGGYLDEISSDDEERRQWLLERAYTKFSAVADSVRESLIKFYGPEHGKAVKTAEAVMVSEYGRYPAPEELKSLFPFFADQA